MDGDLKDEQGSVRNGTSRQLRMLPVADRMAVVAETVWFGSERNEVHDELTTLSWLELVDPFVAGKPPLTSV